MNIERVTYRPEPDYEPVDLTGRVDLLLLSALCCAAFAIVTYAAR